MSITNANTLNHTSAGSLAQKLLWNFHTRPARLLPTQYATKLIRVFQHLRPTRSRLVRDGPGLAVEGVMSSAEALLAHCVLCCTRVGV